MANNIAPVIKEFLKLTSTENFLFSARNFVELLETPNLDKKVFYEKAHLALLDLYSAGHRLELIKLTYALNFKREVKFEYKNANLIATLGTKAFYWDVFNPTDSKEKQEAIQGWLVDDFTDIYHDLKDNLLKIDHVGTNEAVEKAVWKLKWGFSNHWGNQCISALRCFHYLDYEGKQII